MQELHDCLGCLLAIRWLGGGGARLGRWTRQSDGGQDQELLPHLDALLRLGWRSGGLADQGPLPPPLLDEEVQAAKRLLTGTIRQIRGTFGRAREELREREECVVEY